MAPGNAGVIGVAEASDFFGPSSPPGTSTTTASPTSPSRPVRDIGSELDAGAINVLSGSAARLTATATNSFPRQRRGDRRRRRGDIFGFALAGGTSTTTALTTWPSERSAKTSASSGRRLGQHPVRLSARLTRTGNQQFFQGSGGLAGTPRKATSSVLPSSAPATATTTPSLTSPWAPPSKTSAPSWTPALSTPVRLRRRADHHWRPTILPRQRRHRWHPRRRRHLRQPASHEPG